VSLPQVQDYATYVRANGGSGMMIWSLHRKGPPSAQDILTLACTTMGMASCSAPLPM
jgi:hypothetical protein